MKAILLSKTSLDIRVTSWEKGISPKFSGILWGRVSVQSNHRLLSLSSHWFPEKTVDGHSKVWSLLLWIRFYLPCPTQGHISISSNCFSWLLYYKIKNAIISLIIIIILHTFLMPHFLFGYKHTSLLPFITQLTKNCFQFFSLVFLELTLLFLFAHTIPLKLLLWCLSLYIYIIWFYSNINMHSVLYMHVYNIYKIKTKSQYLVLTWFSNIVGGSRLFGNTSFPLFYWFPSSSLATHLP